MGRELFVSPPQNSPNISIPQNKPVYRILSEQGFFGPDDTLHQMGKIIVLHDKPNEDMEPMNDMARKIFEEMLDELDHSAKQVAKTNGRHFAGRPRTKEEMMENASEDARRIQTIQGSKGVPIMGAKHKGAKRVENIGEPDLPDTGRPTPERVEVLG